MQKQWLAIFILLAGVACAAPVAHAEPLAKVGDWSLDQGEVDRLLAAKLYELRNEKTRELVEEHLLNLEATTLGLGNANELLKKKVNSRVGTPSDREVKRFIESNKARLPKGGKGLEERVREHLHGLALEQARQDYIQSLWSKYKVKVFLEAPRFQVNGPTDLSKGKADAPITIIEFSDFECPYCRRAQSTLVALSKMYGDKLRFVFRHFPLPFHKKAPKASEAAQCAADQGKFWPFHNALFADPSLLEIDKLKGLAKKLALDTGRFDKCLDDGVHTGRVAADLKKRTNGWELAALPPF